MGDDKDIEDALKNADETLIAQDVDPAELADPAKEKIELARDLQERNKK